MNKFVKCIALNHNKKAGIIWGTFSIEDEILSFNMPVNEGYFEVGEMYKITFTKYDTISLRPGEARLH